MSNNDIFRRLRYIFDWSDNQVIEIFALADFPVSRAQISDWLKKDDDSEFKNMNDNTLAIFLNGFIIYKRGLKEGTRPLAEKRINNNIVLRKLKIALNLKDEDMLAILLLADFRLSRHELSAFFRNPSQDQYRQCNDQVLRNFLMGLQQKYAKPEQTKVRLQKPGLTNRNTKP